MLSVFGICGYSGSGKTTLIEWLVPALAARGLRVAVLKHDCHGLDVDRPGKDSDRFFKAGADVVAQGPNEVFFRRHGAQELSPMIAVLAPHYDVILVEGHKRSPLLRKVWLLADGETEPPAEAGPVELILGREADRRAEALQWIDSILRGEAVMPPLYAGILIGGRASRMGRPKQLIVRDDKTWVEHIVTALGRSAERIVLLGGGLVPESLREYSLIPDVPGVAGPLAGILAAMRWAPAAAWLIAACDMPMMTPSAVAWLVGERRKDLLGTLPRLSDAGGVEPLFAIYEPAALATLERCEGPSDLARSGRVAAPTIPPALADAWRNFNTPQELAPAE